MSTRKRDGPTCSQSQPYSQKKAKKSAYVSRKRNTELISSNTSKRTVIMPGSHNSTLSMGPNEIKHVLIQANNIYHTQPMGRDQMFAIYDRAYVKSSAIDVAWNPPAIWRESGANNGSYIAELNVWCDTNANISVSQAESQQRCISHGGKTVLKAITCKASGSTVSQVIYDQPLRIKAEAYTKAVTGHGFDDERQIQTAGAAPEEFWYWHCEAYIHGVNNTASDPSYSIFRIINNQETVFFDPKELAVS